MRWRKTRVIDATTATTATTKRWTLLGHFLRLEKETTGNKVITQYFQNKIAGANEERKLTRRGRVLTTLPRLLQRDLREKLTMHERRTYFNIDDLENGRHIEILRRTAVNRSKWRRGVEAMVGKRAHEMDQTQHREVKEESS